MMTGENKDWLKEAPKLASVPKGNPFSVPEGYFSASAEKLKALSALPMEDGFKLPEGYVEQLELNIRAKVALNALVPDKDNAGFVVPEGYFHQLPDRIREKAAVQVRRKKRLLWSYASAASVVLVSALAFLLNTNTVAEPQFSSIPDQQILEYLELYSDASDLPLLVEELSETGINAQMDIPADELEDYINNSY